MTKLEERKAKLKTELRSILKENNFDSRTVETKVLIEFALERATIYKYQKVLMLVEILAKCNDGDYQNC